MGIFVCAGDTPNQESITVPRNDRVANNSNTMMDVLEREREMERKLHFLLVVVLMSGCVIGIAFFGDI